MAQRDLAYALEQHDPRLSRIDQKRVGEWERGRVSRLSFFTVAAIADATETPLSVFADAVRHERAAIRAERDRRAREAWERGRDAVEEDLGEDDGEGRRRGTDDTTR
jgi:transcriptional regulator with XRE-family HTH domain